MGFAQVPHSMLGSAPPNAIALYAAMHRYSSYSTGEGRASRAQLMEGSGIKRPSNYYDARDWLSDNGYAVMHGSDGRMTRYKLISDRPTVDNQSVQHRSTSVPTDGQSDGPTADTTTEVVQSSHKRTITRAHTRKGKVKPDRPRRLDPTPVGVAVAQAMDAVKAKAEARKAADEIRSES